MEKPVFKNVLVTAGPTREKIDPIRFISNLSTGVMGYEVAANAQNRGYKVTLISGPVNIAPPKGVNFVSVENARQMQKQVSARFKTSDCLFMTSAVSDWRPLARSIGKIKRSARVRSLKLTANPDILMEAGRKKGQRLLIGFALESSNLLKNATEKLRKKNLDIIAANLVGGKKVPFGKKLTDVLVVTKNGQKKWLRRVTKKAVAGYRLNKAEELWRDK